MSRLLAAVSVDREIYFITSYRITVTNRFTCRCND